MLNLDTHVLVFAIAGADHLTPRERRLLSSEKWGISAIVLWEMAKLSQLGRIEVDFGDREVQGVLSNLHVWPLDLDVALTSTRLDFRADPADELIAATSLVYDVPLLTHDARIRRSKMVPLA